MNNNFHSNLLDSVCYPLKLSNISLILMAMFCGSFIFLALTFFSTEGLTSLLAVYAIAKGLVPFLLIANRLFEYGLNIIEASLRDNDSLLESPIEYNIAAVLFGEHRITKQILVILIFFTCFQFLFSSGFQFSAYFGLFLLALILPATLVINALSGDFIEIFNPVKLIKISLLIGKPYFLTVLLSSLIFISAVNLPLMGFSGFFALLLFILYMSLILFRFLGLSLIAEKDTFLNNVDFNEEKRERREQAIALEPLDKVLRKTYELVTAGKYEEAKATISPVVSYDNWRRFDQVFSYTSEWPKTKLSLELIKLYLPQLMHENNSLKAFKLCTWALRKDSRFYLKDDDCIFFLIKEASVHEQFKLIIDLINNYLEVVPSNQKTGKLLFSAADICQSHLKSKENYEKFIILYTQWQKSNGIIQ
jgi:hypothetical protein